MEVRLRDYVAGAAMVTDLVNTVAGLKLDDRLTDPAQLRGFLVAHDVEHDDVTERDLAAARALRAELVALFALDPSRPDDLVAAVSAVLARCPHRMSAGPGHAGDRHGNWRVTTTRGASTVDGLRLAAGASLLAVIHALGPERIRDCAAPDCSGMFVDTSNTGRRRFCLPRICGNRVNAARYRARHAARGRAAR